MRYLVLINILALVFIINCGQPNEVYFNKPPSKVIIPKPKYYSEWNNINIELETFRKNELKKITINVKNDFQNLMSFDKEIKDNEGIDNLLNALKN